MIDVELHKLAERLDEDVRLILDATRGLTSIEDVASLASAALDLHEARKRILAYFNRHPLRPGAAK